MPKKNRTKFNKKSQVHQSEENENFSEIIEEEKSNKLKGITKQKKINKDNPYQKFLNNNHDLSQLDYYEKQLQEMETTIIDAYPIIIEVLKISIWNSDN